MHSCVVESDAWEGHLYLGTFSVTADCRDPLAYSYAYDILTLTRYHVRANEVSLLRIYEVVEVYASPAHFDSILARLLQDACQYCAIVSSTLSVNISEAPLVG